MQARVAEIIDFDAYRRRENMKSGERPLSHGAAVAAPPFVWIPVWLMPVWVLPQR
jgi:hypothetical protein